MIDLRAPLFEIGPKTYLHGEAALALALAADEIAQRTGVQVIFTPQYVDIRPIAAATTHLLVFAQHMDPIEPGRGIGAVTAEALVSAGAHGVLLNHAERPLSLLDLRRALSRAHDVGLGTLVCVASQAEAEDLLPLKPDIVLLERPELIGAGSGAVGRDDVRAVTRRLRELDAGVLVMHGAGISGPEDVAEIMRDGADGTGSTSAIMQAPDPAAMMRAMVETVAATWSPTRLSRHVRAHDERKPT